MTNAEAIAWAACPTCAAQLGDPCRDPHVLDHVELLPYPHADRFPAAELARAVLEGRPAGDVQVSKEQFDAAVLRDEELF